MIRVMQMMAVIIMGVMFMLLAIKSVLNDN